MLGLLKLKENLLKLESRINNSDYILLDPKCDS